MACVRSTGPLEPHDAGPRARVSIEERGKLLCHGPGQLFNIRNGDRPFIVAGHVMPYADGQKLNLFAFLYHGNHIAKVFFQIVGWIDREGAVGWGFLA